MKKTRPAIAIDLDDVLAELVPAWLAKYRLCLGDTLMPEDIHTWDIASYATKCSAEVFHGLLTPKLYATVAAYPDARQAIDAAAAFADVYIVTSCRGGHGSRYTGMTGAKEKWLDENLPGALIKDLVFLHDKSRFLCDWIIDDGPHNLEHRAGGGILVDRPWNRDCEKHPRAKTALEAVMLAFDWYRGGVR